MLLCRLAVAGILCAQEPPSAEPVNQAVRRWAAEFPFGERMREQYRIQSSCFFQQLNLYGYVPSTCFAIEPCVCPCVCVCVPRPVPATVLGICSGLVCSVSSPSACLPACERASVRACARVCPELQQDRHILVLSTHQNASFMKHSPCFDWPDKKHCTVPLPCRLEGLCLGCLCVCERERFFRVQLHSTHYDVRLGSASGTGGIEDSSRPLRILVGH